LAAWLAIAAAFSPAGYSSLSGWPMPARAQSGCPTRDEVIDYLTR
jgi:putative flavoprotein involved in K+ transport